MWKVTVYENNGDENSITTCSEYYARQRYRDYTVAKNCGYIKDVKIQEVEDDDKNSDIV